MILQSCSNDSITFPFNIGDEINNKELLIDVTIDRKELVKRAKYKKDTSYILYVYGSKNTLFHFYKTNLQKNEITELIDFFSFKLNSEPIFSQNDTVAYDFICTSYKWKNKKNDVVIIEKSRNRNDPDTTNIVWTLEIRNDTLIEALR